ncbi:hypothetical protein OG336_00185 [[Kitasatospora] papulosa]|uniref:hypothetical protein n=1 Tax=[Kitasatospora] papulosa TaxID=1464011 RepID=UPI002E0FE775|nr:hypothetical protein OG336_00185 [[Kitasatospora] papulosa]
MEKAPAGVNRTRGLGGVLGALGRQLDGLLLEATGLTRQERSAGAMLITGRGRFGPGGKRRLRTEA